MITLHNIDFGYGRTPLYQNLNLTLQDPGVYGIFGRNGSGKSTLLKLLTGLLFPDRGKIAVLGFNPSLRQPSFLQQVYMVPEEFHLPNITLTALERSHGPFYPNFCSEDFRRYCELFELSLTTRFNAMSLGQKKKSVMAFALATHTPLLVMDEPTNGLDIIGRDQFKRIMHSSEQSGRSVLISTHQAHDLQSLIDQVLFFDNGQLVLNAPITSLQQRLRMGIAQGNEEITQCIYQESVGEQIVYVAHNTSGTACAVNLEWLYKAMSLQQAATLRALNMQGGNR